MRVNIYAEELTDRVEVVYKSNVQGHWTGIRFYTELPISYPLPGGHQVTQRGPTIQPPGNEDKSSCVTFWGKDRDTLESTLRRGIDAIRRARHMEGAQGQILSQNVGANKAVGEMLGHSQDQEPYRGR